MIKGKITSAFKVICFVLACALAVGCINNILKPKDVAIETVSTFKQLPENSVDVLFLGSSHAYMGINTGYLWDNWGIASYVLGGNSQPFSSTYFWLRDALRTQHPHVVVMDVFSAVGEARSKEHIVWNTYGDLGFDSKVDGKLVLSSQEELIDHLLEYPNYHSRYSSLNDFDFLYGKGIKNRSEWKGFSTTNDKLSLEEYADASGVVEREPISQEQNEYLAKIIELCEDSGIELVLVNAPFQVSEEEQKRFNTVSDIAVQHEIPFIDYNLLIDEIGISFAGEDTDIVDKHGHLNYRGVKKYNAHLASWLKSRFDIPDRRGDISYDSWQIDADILCAQVDDYDIARISDFASWIGRVANENRFTLVLSFSDVQSEAEMIAELNDVGLPMPSDDLANGLLVIRRAGRTVASTTEDYFLWHETLFSNELMVKRTEEEALVRLGYSEYAPIENGITAFLYDDLRGTLAEACRWKYGSLDRKESLKPLATSAE